MNHTLQFKPRKKDHNKTSSVVTRKVVTQEFKMTKESKSEVSCSKLVESASRYKIYGPRHNIVC